MIISTKKLRTAIGHPDLAIKFVVHKIIGVVSPMFWSIVARLQKIGESPPIKYIKTDDDYTPVDSFWNVYTIIGQELARVKTAYQSRKYLEWRFSVYPLFREFMDLWGNHDNQVILDYGCGAGNDMVGFLEYTNAKKVIGVDISAKALTFASKRLALHRVDLNRVELICISDSTNVMPIEDNSIDYIYCEGVLHHTSDPVSILKEFYRVLKPNCEACIMVYNYDSIWLHLYVAYEQMILQNKFVGMSIYEAFARTTDTEDCPISRCYKPDEFMEMCESMGFRVKYIGGYFSVLELDLFKKYRRVALQDNRLGDEHKEFIRDLVLDGKGYPKYMGRHVGIGGVYKLTKSFIGGKK